MRQGKKRQKLKNKSSLADGVAILDAGAQYGYDIEQVINDLVLGRYVCHSTLRLKSSITMEPGLYPADRRVFTIKMRQNMTSSCLIKVNNAGYLLWYAAHESSYGWPSKVFEASRRRASRS